MGSTMQRNSLGMVKDLMRKLKKETPQEDAIRPATDNSVNG
ncbi:MAG: hypothetical protein WC346_00665 [Methanogenium sp.]|jgi:hypothetical protein